MESDHQSDIDEPNPAQPTDPDEAFFVLTADGIVSGFSPNVRKWWHAESIVALKGRPFDGFFIDPLQPDPGSSDETWTRMKDAGPAGLRLRAKVRGGGGFPSEVRVTALDGGAGAARFLAQVSRREDAPTALPSLTAEPQTVVTGVGRDGAGDPFRMLDGADLGFFEINHRDDTAFFSPGWMRLLGLDADDAVAAPEHFLERMHPEDSLALPAAGARGRPDARLPFRAEVRVRHGALGWRWVELVGVQVFSDLGRLEIVAGAVIDAQDRRDAEEEILGNEARFLALTARGRAGYFEFDLESDTAWFSPEFHHLVGYANGTLGGTPDGFMRLLSPEDAEVGTAAFLEGTLAESGGMTCGLVLQHHDGRSIGIEAYLVARRGRDGRIASVSGLATAAVAPGTATSTASGIAHEVLDVVAEAVFVVDADRRILHANTRALRLAQREEDAATIAGEPLGSVLPLIERVSGAPAPDLVARVLEGGPPIELDHTYALPGEPTIEVVVSCRAFTDADGRRVGAVLAVRDPAEMPLSPAELLSSNRMELLGRLACGVAFDFNNLLTTIGGGIALAMEKREWAPLEAVNKAALAAQHLTRQMLSFATEQVPERKSCALNALLRDTARMAGAGSPTAIELELADDVYPVHADPTQLVQLFTNLFVNALQAMPGGGRVSVRSFNTPLARVNSVDLPPGDYVRVDVQDNGPGIAPEHLSRIFEPFFSTWREGSGLGLSMARSILQQHDGAIEVASTLGSGATFTIYLPRAYKDPVKDAPTPASVSLGSGRILVMDDDPDLCMIAAGMLEMVGYTADTAENAADTIALYRKHLDIGRPYAAIILDLTIPGGPGGREVLNEIRALHPAVKAIVSSGYASEEDKGQYVAMGFTAVLGKPYRSSDVARVLKEVLGG